MLRIFSRRSNKVRIILCTFILTFAIMQVTPVEVTASVTASTEIISEDFTNTTYRDSETNASWWGDGSLRIPPKSATFTDYCDLSEYGVKDSYVDGTMMYIAIDDYGYHTGAIDIVDISVPASPVLVATVPTTAAWGVAVSGIWMYVASFTTGLEVYNITDYQNSPLVSSFGPSQAAHVYVEGSYAYLTTLDQGIQIFDVSTPQSIVSVANYTTIDYSAFKRVTKVGDLLFTCDSTASGYPAGVHIVNVTDPADPTFVSRCSTQYRTNDIFIIDDYVFGIGGLGLFAMSISNISEPTIVNSVAGVGGGRGSLVRDNDYLYCCWGSSGLLVVDISDPYDLQVDEINSTISSYYTTFNDGFIYNARYSGGQFLQAHRLDWAYNAVASSLSIYETPLDTFSITEATLNANATTPAPASIDYYLSADNGTHWEEVAPGTLHSFSNLGTILKWKVIMDTTIPTYTSVISSINVSLKIQLNPISLNAVSVSPDYNKPSWTWDSLEGADGYRFQFDEVNTFDSPNLINEVFDKYTNSYAISTPLENGTYYYRMAAIDEDGDTGIFTNTRHVLVGSLSTTTTTSTNGSGLPLDPLILAIGAISIVGLVVVVVIIQKRKSG